MRQSGTWAKTKLDYLRRYINVFENAMYAKWPCRNYVDLQAGPGKNAIRGTDEVVLGSPLLALTADHPFTSYHFIEYDVRNVDALTQRCSRSPNSNLVSIYSGDCNVLVDNIVTSLKRDEATSLNLGFLDPEGFELRWSTVAAIAAVRRMDLIINYPEGGLNRLMRRASTTNSETPIDLYFGT